MYHMEDMTYQRMTPNQQGHYSILPMQVELGVWQGKYFNFSSQTWLRWWDTDGNLLLTGQERANWAEQQVIQEQQKRQQLAAQLKSLNLDQLAELGIDPSLLE